MKKTRTGFALILATLLTLISIGAVFLYFNNKLNRQFHVLQDTMSKSSIDFGSRVQLDASPYDPRGYYYSWTENQITIEQDQQIKKDNRGVRLTFLFNEWIYHPVSIAQYGLAEVSNYIYTNDKYYLDEAVNQGNYFIEEAQKNDGYLYYNIDNYQVPGTDYTLRAPWASAMGQGLALSLLSRLYDITGDEKYRLVCELILKPLTVSVNDGGLKTDFNGNTFFEEYPSTFPSYVLNGFMFTLIGLYDCKEIVQSNLADELYRKGIETLKRILPYYDHNGISCYHLAHLNGTKLPVHYSSKYHKLHITQLNLLYKIEEAEIFMFYRDRWLDYTE